MCGIDIPRQQVFDAVDGMVGDASHHVPQIGFGIQTVEFRRTDQAVDRRCTFSSGIAREPFRAPIAGEQLSGGNSCCCLTRRR